MKNLRLLPALLLSSFFLLPSAFSAPAVTLPRVLPGYQTAENFKRITEYFDGQENASGQILLRSQATSRDGYYFLLRLENPEAAQSNLVAELQIITPEAPAAKTYAFPLATLPRGSRIVQLGLTGSDWPDAKAHPVAWQIRLLAADGTELLRRQSHLWK